MGNDGVKIEDCLTIDEAIEEVGVSRSHFYNYMRYLKIRTHRFPFQRNSYITLTDIRRIRELKNMGQS